MRGEKPGSMERAKALVERERRVLLQHREKLRGSAFPPVAPRESSFAHGFLLPFSLVVATMRQPFLGARLLGIVVVRAIMLAAIASVLLARMHAPDQGGEDSWRLVVEHRWAWVVWYVTMISLTEAAIAHLSRRYDEHLAWHIAAIARIRPETPYPPLPGISIGLGELYAKARRFVRGYIILGMAAPALVFAAFLPFVGGIVSPIVIFAWTVYWFSVFSAGKTLHAYADDAIAPPPRVFREVLAITASTPWLSPFHRLSRLATRIARSANAPAMAFSRAPAAYLGFALARVVLSLPGLYSLSRPVIPVAAGRLFAESDPHGRFSA